MIEENLNKLLELLPGRESYNTRVKALEDENKDSIQSVEDSQLSLSPSKTFLSYSAQIFRTILTLYDVQNDLGVFQLFKEVF